MIPKVTRATVGGFVLVYAVAILGMFGCGAWAVIGRDRLAFFVTLALMALTLILVTMVENASKRLLCDGGLLETHGAEIAGAVRAARTLLLIGTALPLVGYAFYQFGPRTVVTLVILGACVIVWLVASMAAPARVVGRFG